MSLFQTSVLNKYLKRLDDSKVDKAFEKFKNHFHNPIIQENIRNSKEEQYQGEFLIDLFVNVLGYIKNPNPEFNLTTELKNIKDAKKTDGAILSDGKAIAVIELKGTKTVNLDTIESQAFGYKNNQPGCNYVITSNFEKLKFYIDDAVYGETFDLFNLSKDRFKLLYLCLSSDYLLGNIPKKIKDESLTQEEKVTKKLYRDYSLFRNEIFQSLLKDNEGYDKLILFKKTQKLLDRFLFIFFAEDRGLLPPNAIRFIVNQWTDLRDKYDEYFPLYDRFKKYFRYMNTGHKGEQGEIFAFGGDLFVPDEILDHINIDDEILYKYTVNLSNYDFADEVSVDILGHIFEHSLNDIDEIQSEIKGAELDKRKSKRKKDGVFYTPKYITKYIVDNTVGRLCNEKKIELQLVEEEYSKDRKGRKKSKIKDLNAILESYRNWLLQITICDPACGSGAFLNQALEFLISEHNHINELQANLFGEAIVLSKVEDAILENNIYGVDINNESIEIAKLSLWLRTAQKDRKLTSLNNNIKCGNSLIDDVEVAGEKAFNWEKEFPHVFEKGGFDIIIGNPPYVFARDNFSEEEKSFYVKKYISAKYQINTYLLFMEKTVEILKNKGVYGLIIPNSWLMMYSGEGLRSYLIETNRINQIINLTGYSFESANVETVILLSEKEILNDEDNNEIDVLLNNGTEFYISHKKKQKDFKENKGFEFKVFLDDEGANLSEKLQTDSENLDDLVLIKAGLQAYEKNKGEPKQTAEDVKNRPYDYEFKFDDDTHKYLEGKDVGRYFVSWSGQYLRYGKHLAAPRTFDLFSDEKIILREITGKFPNCLISTYSNELYLYNRSNIAIVKRKEKDINLKYINVILNSKLMSYYFIKNTAKSVRKMFPKIILNDLRKFPIKEISKEKQEPFIQKAENILNLNGTLQNSIVKFTKYLQSQFSIEKLSKKLQNWHDLEFGDFIKELNKAIKKVGGEKLTKTDEIDWMDVFETKKAEAQTLKAEIDKTDREIDQMVYALYGLTEEEIQIVENN